MESFTLHTDTGNHTFTGKVIGASTSEAQHHNHEGPFLLPSITRDGTGRRLKCSACRWLETTIYVTDTDKYVVHTIGRTIVPGEQDYPRVTFTESAYEVVELLTVRGHDEPFIPRPSARALAQAADRDDDMHDAYVNRAVTR